jgi:glycosyltransferase involved in cell wall biosynthesis
VVVAAKNEEINIEKCLSALSRASEIVVVDSHSVDNTSLIAESMGARVVNFDYFGGYPKKRQWALDNLEFKGDWILVVDADEVIPDELWAEIEDEIYSSNPKDAYLVTKGFHFLGRQFRFGGFSHDAVIFFRKGAARFEKLISDDKSGLDMEVHERVIVEGAIGSLRTPLLHEDLKGLHAYIERHNDYSTWEAKLRLDFASTRQYGVESIRPSFLGNTQERRRFLKKLVMTLPFEPFIWFCYHYFLRLGFLEGQPGYIASRLRSQYIFAVKAKLKEMTTTIDRD